MPYNRFDFSMLYRCQPQLIASQQQRVRTLLPHVMQFHRSNNKHERKKEDPMNRKLDGERIELEAYNYR